AEEPTRWFTHLGPPRDDGQGRLWAVLQHGDSTTADVYSGSDLLGSVTIDCPGFGGQWDVAGDWLVLLCISRDPDSVFDAEIRRWRIVDWPTLVEHAGRRAGASNPAGGNHGERTESAGTGAPDPRHPRRARVAGRRGYDRSRRPHPGEHPQSSRHLACRLRGARRRRPQPRGRAAL